MYIYSYAENSKVEGGETYIYSHAEIERILEKYGDTIYRAAYIQLKSRDKADDIYQEVCIKLLRLKPRIENEEHLKAWLLRATIDCCKDFWKSAWYRKVTVDNQMVTEQMEEKEEQAAGYLTECMQQLPGKYSAVLHLFYYEEYSIKEIAQILDIKENTVASRLSRGRDKLRKILGKGGDNYEF
ncbi:MAG: sigma-70 family RNA polymerase sigma factor [Lachnospiraceae bacterium]|nr:sigma-70 family RNA polymerase sigma factor [Lachnospiraceae bacterium]